MNIRLGKTKIKITLSKNLYKPLCLRKKGSRRRIFVLFLALVIVASQTQSLNAFYEKAISWQNSASDKFSHLPREKTDEKELIKKEKDDFYGSEKIRLEIKSPQKDTQLETDLPLDVKVARPGGDAIEKEKPEEPLSLLDKITDFVGITSHAPAKIIHYEFIDSQGKGVNLDPSFKISNEGKVDMELSGLEYSSLRPGKYKMKLEILSPNEKKVYTAEQDFTWGVLAINTNKSIYQPDDKAHLAMAVLNDKGEMVCDAVLELTIKNKEQEISEKLSTKDGSIKVTSQCHSKEFSLEPDYEAEYRVEKEGVYQMELTAWTHDGKREIKDSFEVKKGVPLDVERLTATRIYPPLQYPVLLKVEAKEDFKGKVIELVPADFYVSKKEGDKEFNDFDELKHKGAVKELLWNIDLKKGDKITLGYQYDAPDLSPRLYLLGPLSFFKEDQLFFQEARKWQVAVDAATYTGKSLRTVEYILGGGAGTGQYQTGTYNPAAALASNTTVYAGTSWNTTKGSAGTKTVKLLGDNIRVVSAYLNFACEATSSANATDVSIMLDVNPGPNNGTDVMLDSIGQNSNVYYETSGQAAYQMSTQADATALFQGQSDAQWVTGLAVVAGMRVVGPTTLIHTIKLTLTYEEDYTTAANDQTKTVRFPLDSTNGTDIGTRQADCAVSSTCSFTYDTTSRMQDVLSGATANIYDAWFEISGIADTTAVAGGFVNFTPTINGGASGTAIQTVEVVAADNVGFNVVYRPSIATNNFDPLVTASDTVDITNAAAVPISGLTIELVVTYAYSTGDADPQTETIRYYEFMHTTNPTLATRYNFTGAQGSTNVTISNTGLDVRNLWFKVQTSAVATSQLQIYGKVGAATETSNSFNLTSAQLRVGSSPVILDLTGQVEGGTDYFSAATTAVTGGYQWNTATGSVVAAEC